jgi:hypothetical protein
MPEWAVRFRHGAMVGWVNFKIDSILFDQVSEWFKETDLRSVGRKSARVRIPPWSFGREGIYAMANGLASGSTVPGRERFNSVT